MTMLIKQGQVESFDAKWPSAHNTVVMLLQQENVSKSEWQDLFVTVHNISVWDEDGSKKLYDALRKDITDFIKMAQKRVMAHQEDSTLLKAYIGEWSKFFTQCDYLPKPFNPLEGAMGGKSHLSGPKKSEDNEKIVRKLMLDSWNQSIFQDIKHRLQDSAMKLVQMERSGDVIDTHLVIGVRESYVNLCTNSDQRLKIYQENFERAYLESTESFYRSQAAVFLQLNGVRDYMRYAARKLEEEEERARRYLETRQGCNSVAKLVQRCVDVLVSSFRETILAECAVMINASETEQLSLMFGLMDRVPDGIQPMLRVLEEHIKCAGLADMRSAAAEIVLNSDKYVERLLMLFQRFSALVRGAFRNDPRFLTARDKAYTDVVNDVSVFKLELPQLGGQGAVGAAGSKTSNSMSKPESKCPELLANYCDMMLRKSQWSKKLTSEEIEQRLRNVLLVLKYVHNKDVFMKYQKSHLTRRLILDTSADNDKEENMVEWLRETGMPADYVNKLARMFQDIKVSADLNAEFKEQLRNNNEDIADTVSIKILNMGSWVRLSERVAVTLPRELEDYIPKVEEFYRLKHSGRKLQWNHLLSHGVIQFDSDAGRYDLEVSTFQMTVLYAWQQRRHERLSFDALRLATELPDAELRRTLWSLASPAKNRRQLLLMDPATQRCQDFDATTQFWLNNDFAMLMKNGNVQRRGKVNFIGRLQLNVERVREEENEEIVRLRIFRVQEAINKIMKMRKKLQNAELCSELINILRNQFVPSKKLIKEQIEWLIQNDYLRRDENDMNLYLYRA